MHRHPVTGENVPAAEPGDDHPMIAAHLARLARDLPRDLVEELADGLRETYEHYAARVLEPDRAAAVAIAEFGDPDTLVTAFERQAPGRRAARLLLATGPPVGLCWAAALLTGRAWTWPVPPALPIAAACALLALIAVLVRLARGRVPYRTLNRHAATASTGVLLLDLAFVLATLLVLRQLAGAVVLCAVLASSVRAALAARQVRTLLRA